MVWSTVLELFLYLRMGNENSGSVKMMEKFYSLLIEVSFMLLRYVQQRSSSSSSCSSQQFFKQNWVLNIWSFRCNISFEFDSWTLPLFMTYRSKVIVNYSQQPGWSSSQKVAGTAKLSPLINFACERRQLNERPRIIKFGYPICFMKLDACILLKSSAVCRHL